MGNKVLGIGLAFALAIAFLAACSASDGGDEAFGDSRAQGTVAAPRTLTPETILRNRAEMAAAVAESLDAPLYFHDSEWDLDFGDGNMFGPSYDLASSTLTGDAAQFDRAIDALNRSMAAVDDASGSVRGLIGGFGDLENLAMALMGLIESAQYIDVPPYADSAERLVAIVDRVGALFGDYLPPELGEFAGSTYGPTSISTLLALLRVGLALGGPEDEAAGHMARAAEILDHIHETAWSDELGAYRFAPGDDRLMLYPNATMMMACGRAYRVSGDPVYLDRIEAIYDGIQPLRAASGDHYHSPYSREEAGAVDEDYATLSSQNYLMIGLWLAYTATGDARYLEDLDRVLRWIETHLFVDGVLKHHWVNGRVANDQDLYDFCSGCNLQTLFILRTIELEADLAPRE